LSDYGPGVRPICPNQETIHVTVDMAIRQLISLVSIINEREGVIQIRQNMIPPIIQNVYNIETSFSIDFNHNKMRNKTCNTVRKFQTLINLIIKTGANSAPLTHIYNNHSLCWLGRYTSIKMAGLN